MVHCCQLASHWTNNWDVCPVADCSKHELQRRRKHGRDSDALVEHAAQVSKENRILSLTAPTFATHYSLYKRVHDDCVYAILLTTPYSAGTKINRHRSLA